MTDEVILMLRMSVPDLALLYSLASKEGMRVGDFIMKLVFKRLRQIQDEWSQKRQQGLAQAAKE